MPIVTRIISAPARLAGVLVKRAVRLAIFTAIGAVLLFVLDLLLVRDHTPPER